MLYRLKLRLAQFRALAGCERVALFAAWMALPLAWGALHSLGLARCLALLARPQPRGTQPLATNELSVLVVSVERAGRHSPFPSTCLTRSLALCWLLRRRGVHGALRIGVQRAEGLLQAHAWVECDGIPINDTPQAVRDFAALEPA